MKRKHAVKAADSLPTTGNPGPAQKPLQLGGMHTYHIVSNCNLYATSEFDVVAKNEKAATGKANRILDQCDFCVSALVAGGPPVTTDIHPDNVETQVIEVTKAEAAPESALGEAPQTRARVGAFIGELVLMKMENLVMSEDGMDKEYGSIMAEMCEEMRHGLFGVLWEAYTELYPEQAAPQESPGASEPTRPSPNGDEAKIAARFFEPNRPFQTNTNQTIDSIPD